MKKLFILAGILALTATPSFANDSKKTAKMDYYFNKIDTNHDGYISEVENQTFAGNKFVEADSNDDNRLSRQEVIDQKNREKNAYHPKSASDINDYERRSFAR